MVEKKKKRKRKVKPRVGQTITQKVIVNLGKTAPRRRTGTQAKRSVQPQQVTYQNSPIPLQPDYSSRINDLRDEVVRHLSGVDKEEFRVENYYGLLLNVPKNVDLHLPLFL